MRGSQATFGEFAEESADPFDFEDYGPTMKRPLPAEIVGLEPWKERMRAVGLSPGCLAEWHSHGGLPDYHVDDRETKRDRLAAEQLEGLAPDQDNSADDARSTTRAVATDGGQVVEAKDKPSPGDEVLLIENPAVGLNTSPSIISGEVSGSGKSVMIPEDEGLSNSRKRLDASEIFAGESEYRDSTGFELYTPGRYRSTQRSNHAPGPQAGANGISDIGALPEPTHWPLGDDPEDAPDACPMCGEDPGRWQDVGKPRCERCGETIDPEADNHHQDEEPEKWDLEQYERGDVLTLEKHRGEFLIIGFKDMVGGPRVALDVLDNDGEVYRLRKVDAGGYFFDVRPGHYDGGQFHEAGGPGPVIRNVDAMDDVQDFEVIDHDEQRLRRWIRENRGH